MAGLALLALWLGWTVPALWMQRLPTHDGSWDDAAVLAQIPASVLMHGIGQPRLLLGRGECSCSAVPPAETGAGVGVDHLPFEWVVLDAGHRLVYAGPAMLERHCGARQVSAAALVTGLLSHPQPALILSDRCSCRQE
ncbi:hypothetical protein RZA67_08750 [Stenotrophomonas sp. C3(2023)]|uniref:hypothetical protein n=1 Tax=Stenotrophomonas sp. C3(2023) TaxID=3080277 RepID=UPI00293C42CA|nr:hypothetical protein [Stenotrophomonas sp. C3(2023)]MDV3468814.1 hypothetical protein [Stenotrophomonas sp. C3(2023)]